MPPSEPAPEVVLVVALRPEAQPFIDHFALRRDDSGGPFALFTGAGAPALVVSGPGRVAAGAAVAHAASHWPEGAWLNIGIAGHARHALGSAFLAHRVRDAASGRAWYPPLVFAPRCPTSSLQTVDQPCTEFVDDDLYDMEGAGFYEVAARHAPHELVHCFKVVSDNRDHPATLLNRARVDELVRGNLAPACVIIEELATLARQMRRLRAEPAGMDEVLSAAHFSVTRRRQLRRALRRWAAVRPQDDAAAWLRERDCPDARAILAALERRLDEHAPLLQAKR